MQVWRQLGRSTNKKFILSKWKKIFIYINDLMQQKENLLEIIKLILHHWVSCHRCCSLYTHTRTHTKATNEYKSEDSYKWCWWIEWKHKKERSMNSAIFLLLIRIRSILLGFFSSFSSIPLFCMMALLVFSWLQICILKRGGDKIDAILLVLSYIIQLRHWYAFVQSREKIIYI